MLEAWQPTESRSLILAHNPSCLRFVLLLTWFDIIESVVGRIKEVKKCFKPNKTNSL